MSGALSAVAAVASVIFGGPNTVQIDDVILQGFEVPEKITWGTDQQVVIHTFPGGERNIQRMGPKPKPLSWSGIMLGPNAVSRARQLEQIAADGDDAFLTWGEFAYDVVVTSFEADYRRSNWIGAYRITCEVQQDVSPPPSPSLLSAVTDDISSALGIDVAGTLATADAALTQVQAVVQPLAGLVPGTSGFINAMSGLTQAQTVIGGLSDASNGAMGGLINAAAATGLTRSFPQILSTSQSIAMLPAMGAYTGRAVTNMTNAT